MCWRYAVIQYIGMTFYYVSSSYSIESVRYKKTSTLKRRSLMKCFMYVVRLSRQSF